MKKRSIPRKIWYSTQLQLGLQKLRQVEDTRIHAASAHSAYYAKASRIRSGKRCGHQTLSGIPTHVLNTL